MATLCASQGVDTYCDFCPERSARESLQGHSFTPFIFLLEVPPPTVLAPPPTLARTAPSHCLRFSQHCGLRLRHCLDCTFMACDPHQNVSTSGVRSLSVLRTIPFRASCQRRAQRAGRTHAEWAVESRASASARTLYQKVSGRF